MHLNKVFLNLTTKRTLRVIFVDLEYCMVFDIEDPSAWPFDLSLEDLSDEAYFQEIEEPYTLPTVEENSDIAKKRDDAYLSILSLLENHIVILDKKKRNELIRKQVEDTKKSRIYILRQLRRYWQRGLCPNALAPEFEKRGGKGQTRRNIKNKSGAKRKYTKGTGIIITEEIADLFHFVLKHFFRLNENINLKEARKKVNQIFKSRYPADAFNLPTARQFEYFYQKNYSKKAMLEARTPKIILNKDIRPLTSTATVNNYGPGSRYEIDATIADIYLISEFDRNRIIGRPVIYKVKDVFSRMIVGLYVGLENPSWATASIALAHAFSNKVEFCKKYGINIDSSCWPSEGLPAIISADRGELLSKQADILEYHFGIKLVNTRAYRGDDKGIVERSFREMHAKILPYAKGVVKPFNGKKVIGGRYELDAELSLYEFTKLIINNVINYNNNHVLSKYDRSKNMPTSLPNIPIELWNWGIKNRTSKLKTVDNKLIRINLLPQKKADVSDLGIKFNELFYTCDEALRLGWFHRSKVIPRPDKVNISYDPRNTNIIYLRAEKNIESYWECLLHDRSREYEDMTFQEAKQQLEESKHTQAVAKQKEDFTAPDYLKDNEDIIKKARDKNSEQPNAFTNTERLSAKGDSRNKEKERERQKARDALKTENTTPADVIPIKQSQQFKESLDFPDPEDDDEDY